MVNAIITEAGMYAEFSHVDRSLAQFVLLYLPEGTPIDSALVLPLAQLPEPEFDPKIEVLIESFQLLPDQSALQRSWSKVQLSPEEIRQNSGPDPAGFLRACFSRTDLDLFAIYEKLLALSCSSLVVNTWFNQLASSASPELFIREGWNVIMYQLADSAQLNPQERALINSRLIAFDLDPVL